MEPSGSIDVPSLIPNMHARTCRSRPGDRCGQTSARARNHIRIPRSLRQRGHRRVRTLRLRKPGMMPDVRSNWPVRLTTFVGREDERAAVAQLLGDRRLVTLTGTGGVGKTRLALEIGADLRGAYRDGGFFVELASVVDASAVPQRIAEALGIGETAGEPLLDALVRALRRSRCLLILDNCE